MTNKKITNPKTVSFQNGCNKVVIEFRVVQLCSEIILVISNHAYDSRPIALHLVQLPLFIALKHMVAKVHFHRTEKKSDWYIYTKFAGYEDPKNAHKSKQKSCNIYKSSMHNVVSAGTN